MAVSRTQASAVATSTGGTTVAPSWPGATTAGALLVACVGVCGTGTAGTVTPPDGSWTTADTVYPGSNAPRAYIFYKANASSESGSKTFTNSQTDDMWAVMVEYAGAATSSPLDVFANNGSTGGSSTADSGTTGATGQADEVAVAILISRNTNTYSSPTNSFSLVDQGQSGNGTAAEAVDGCWLEKILSSTGAQNVSTTNTSRPWTGVIATFKAASGGGTDATVAGTVAGAAAGAAVPVVFTSPRANVRIGSSSGA